MTEEKTGKVVKLVGKAKFEKLYNDLFWSIFVKADDDHYCRLKWQGYNDADWWNEYKKPHQRCPVCGRVYAIDFQFGDSDVYLVFTPKLYCKKLFVEAVLLTKENIKEVRGWLYVNGRDSFTRDGWLYIQAGGGYIRAKPNEHYIVKEGDRFYIVEERAFRQTYEEVVR